jgi:hypothetical protein
VPFYFRNLLPTSLLYISLLLIYDDDADLIVVASKVFDDNLELVTDVQLVRVKEQQDQVRALGKPFAHL